MADLTEVEIEELVKEKEEELNLLNEQQEEHFDLLTLKEYVPTDSDGNVMTGYESYTSSQPRNFFDKVTDALNRS